MASKLDANVTVQVGDKHLVIAANVLPPVGTQIFVHKHLFDGSTSPLVEVVSHEWRLEEASAESELPTFSVTIKTRVVGQRTS